MRGGLKIADWHGITTAIGLFCWKTRSRSRGVTWPGSRKRICSIRN